MLSICFLILCLIPSILPENDGSIGASGGRQRNASLLVYVSILVAKNKKDKNRKIACINKELVCFSPLLVLITS